MYGQTWDDLGITPPQRAWQMLRSLRHAPPGPASKGERKATFGAALEQAEQLFAAATLATPAASPLLLFYGLSQAGRAVAAAAAGKDNANRWRLTKHGITNDAPAGPKADNLSMLNVQNQGTGAFTQLAEILGAASLPTPVPLGNLWCLLPEASRFPLPGMGTQRPIRVNPRFNRRSDDGTARASVPVPSALVSKADMGPDPSGTATNWDEKRVAIRTFLTGFPSIAGWRFTSHDGQPPEVSGYSETYTSIEIQWAWPKELAYDAALLQHVMPYRSGYLAFPAIGTDERSPHPLLIWWAVLYTLSKLARYEPSSWALLISINSSSAAAAIENLLRESMVTLPELIHRTIREVASGKE